jgi:hypothetical protein
MRPLWRCAVEQKVRPPQLAASFIPDAYMWLASNLRANLRQSIPHSPGERSGGRLFPPSCDLALADRASAKLSEMESLQRLRFLEGLLTVNLFRSQAAPWFIIPIVEPARPAIGEPDFKAAALRQGLVLDQSDRHAP